MNRRHFLALSSLAGITGGPLSVVLRANEEKPAPERSRFGTSLLKKLLATPQVAFPTLTPTFAAMFAPGAGATQLVRSETWDDFNTQTQNQSNNGYVLSAMTSIQNLNRTWFFGAYQKGTGNYQLLRTSDPNAFQQMFTQLQNTYTLVDFNIAWELGQIYYSGYWLANPAGSKGAGQMLLWDLNYSDLTAQWKTLSTTQAMRMTRIQVYPQNATAAYSAIFAPGADSYVLYGEAANTFFADVTGRFNTNSLVDVSFDPTSGNMLGCWRKSVSPSQFVFNQTWDQLTAAAQQASTGGMVLTSMTAYPNAPDFDDFFATNEAPFVEGYAYAVALNGQVIANGGGYARSSAQPQNPNVPFTPDTRMNVASVSKAVTGIALEVLLLQKGMSLDTPFWPLIKTMVPSPDPSVKSVTLRNLATMKSGMVQQVGEGPLSPPAGFTDISSYLNNYLAQPLTGTPGVTYFYDNTNFTILQGVIQQVSGMAYTDYVTQNVLVPAGIDPAIFNATPDPSNTATLQYSGPSDTRTGNYWGPLTFVAPGGWISSARELIKILIAMRGTSVLPANVVTEMFNDLIGWDGQIVGNFGTYYHKNGGLTNGLTPPQQLNTCLVRLAEGYDVALVANSEAPLDVVTQCVDAFDSRGVQLANEPANNPSLTSVVHGASFLPNCAPGAYVSVIGAGLPGPAASWSPTNALPTELNGVQVRIGSQNAYIAYAGPTQINCLLPASVPAGIANVELTTPAGAMTSSVQINAIAPGLFTYQLNGKSYPAALFAGTAVLVAAAGAFGGTASRAAVAGDYVELYGTGMGPTNPAAPDGVVFASAYPAASLSAFQATIGGKAATVSFAGLVGPGLFQLDFQIPAGVPAGDQALVLSVSGIAVQPNLLLTIGS